MIRRTWAAAIAASMMIAGSVSAEDGFVSLFDGKTLSGWEMKANAKNRDSSKWEVKDGAIVGSGNASMLTAPKAAIRTSSSGPRSRSTTRAIRASIPHARRPQRRFLQGLRVPDSTPLTAIRSRPAPSTRWFTSTRPHTAPTNLHQEVEVQDVMYRGKPVTRKPHRVNGKLLYEYQDYNPAWKEGHFGFQQHDPGSVVKIRKIEVKEPFRREMTEDDSRAGPAEAPLPGPVFFSATATWLSLQSRDPRTPARESPGSPSSRSGISVSRPKSPSSGWVSNRNSRTGVLQDEINLPDLGLGDRGARNQSLRFR